MPSPETRDQIQWMLGTLLAVLALVGLLARYVVLPWIRSQLVQPLAETRHQVLINGGTSEPPTVRDEIAALAGEMRSSHAEIKRDIGGIRQELREERTERREAVAELRRHLS